MILPLPDFYVQNKCGPCKQDCTLGTHEGGPLISKACNSTQIDENQANSTFFLVSFPQKRNGIVFSSGVNYLYSDL